ncbi:MAG: MFS transporter [Actinocrinis sp.]
MTNQAESTSLPASTAHLDSAAVLAPPLPPSTPGARLRAGVSRFSINRDFGRYWFGQSLNAVAGRSINLLFPLVAVVSLHASTAAVGLVNAAQYAPVLLLSLYAGGWMVGKARRPIMVAANLLSAAFLAVVPIVSGLGSLHIGVLYAVIFAIGAATSFSDVCSLAYTTELVEPGQLMAANSRLETTSSIATVAAPGFGGLLMGWFGGSTSLTVCAAAYLAAGLSILTVRRRRAMTRAEAAAALVQATDQTVDTQRPRTDAAPGSPGESQDSNPDTVSTAVTDSAIDSANSSGSGTLVRIKQGVRFTWRVPLLRYIDLLAAWFNLFEQAVLTLYVVYAVRTLGFSAGLLGLTMTIGGLGPVLGPALAARMGRRFGAARTMILTMAMATVAPLLIPVAHGSKPMAFVLCTVAFVVYGFGLTVFNVFIVTAQQRTTPEHLLPQVAATKRFAAYGTIGIGAAVGGVAGEWLGLRPALYAAVIALVIGWAAFSVVLLRSGSTGDGGPDEVPASALEPIG